MSGETLLTTYESEQENKENRLAIQLSGLVKQENSHSYSGNLRVLGSAISDNNNIILKEDKQR